MDVKQRITARLAEELSVRPEQVAATVERLDGGATVPFIARYRKEVTGALDDTQLRQLDERLRYLRELEERREAVLAAIDEQGTLDPTLNATIPAGSPRIFVTNSSEQDFYPKMTARDATGVKRRQLFVEVTRDVRRRTGSGTFV